MAALSNHVSISITQDSVGLKLAGFGIPMILSYTTSGWGTQRIRFYNSLSEVAADFAVTTSWPSVLEATKRSFGALPTHAALIAGGWEGGSPLHEEEEGRYERLVHGNLDTVHRALRALLPAMVDAKRPASVANR